MKRKCILVGILALVAGGDTLAGGRFPPRVGKPGAEPRQPNAHRKAVQLNDYSGVVSDIGPDWLELRPGWEPSELGKKKPYNNKKPKRVSALGTVVGGNPQGEGRGTTYRLTDLKVGDIVSVETGITREGEEYCLQILINRRPGGIIPPEPGERFPDRYGIHIRNQAEQDWEEKGIPIPKKYLDPNGRTPWTNPPYPPVAPMPRAAKP
jgi:hypothetical protein